MIRFSNIQKGIPKMAQPVYLVTGGMSQFARAFPTKRTEELCIDGFNMAAMLLGMKSAELKRFIHSCYYGHFADHFGDQLLGESVIHDRLGLDPLGNVGVKTGGATGGSTIWEAFKTVASGYSPCVLALGWERMDEVPTDEGNHLIASAADKDWETNLGHIYAGYYAVMAQRYWRIFGKSDPKFRETLAKIAVRNHGYAYHNPFAQDGRKITVQDVLESPIVADPLRQLDCCLMSVGSSCVILANEETAMEMTKGTGMVPLRIYVGAGSHTLRTGDRRDMEIPLLPNETEETYKDLGERFPGGDLYPGFTGFLAARMASYYAYGMAGIVNPVDDFDLVEDHDAFTISSVQSWEDIGLRHYGEGRDFLESGDGYFEGKCPNNLSGGLMGTMHAVGATGIMQVVECMLQIHGRHGEIHGDAARWESFGKQKPEDWKDLQLDKCNRALAISHAGVGSHVTSTILAHPDHLLEGRAK